MATPMATNAKLTLEEEGESFDSTKFQENPKTSHVEAVKRIVRYLKGTMHLGLWHPKFTGVDIMRFSDSDHEGSLIDRKSTSDVCAFVDLYLTSWFLKKQTSVALSTTEAKYVSVGRACAQVLWMK
ncbi:secreted RxLR effector protein 161-like [Rutidosis leptorrhynchoides]|uniref:secreted RxLR effector protein 161-like n=1 Tax=Rutidosis leptorrhynchoides TaxID=125765 RepID=UPI003A99D474